MNLIDLLSEDRVSTDVEASSKKRALELLAHALSQSEQTLDEQEIFNGLLARERLGSTGLGQGAAIPHSRIEGLDRAVGAVIKLDEGVDFDARDRQPVDLLFGLAVPSSCTDEHLKILATLAKLLSDHHATQDLREADSSQRMLQIIELWNRADAA